MPAEPHHPRFPDSPPMQNHLLCRQVLGSPLVSTSRHQSVSPLTIHIKNFHRSELLHPIITSHPHTIRNARPNRIKSQDELDEQNVGRGGQRRRRGGPQGPRILPLELHPPLHPPARQESGRVLVFSGQQQ
ncbi:hypothetical protein NL676_000791 [Syzygium grande]|nr:hypothetical protein NL676_000791 [Syzygium grande]